LNPISDKQICLGETASFDAFVSGGTGAFNYNWTPAFDFTSPAGDMVSVTPNSIGSTNYSLTAQNDCPGATIGFKLTVHPLPEIDLQSKTPLCEKEAFEVSNSLHQPNHIVYSWDFNDGGFSSEIQQTAYSYANSGSYTINLTVEDANTCTNSASGNLIIVHPKPVAVIYNSPDASLNTNSVVFFTGNQSQSEIQNYQWSFSEFGNATSEDTVLTFSEPGTYLVQLVVSDDYCMDTTWKAIEILSDYGIFLPSGFSPNDDGDNDYFSAKGFGIGEFQMQIWDRWGELVFETDNACRLEWQKEKFRKYSCS
jgi:PKD repeat protein